MLRSASGSNFSNKYIIIINKGFARRDASHATERERADATAIWPTMMAVVVALPPLLLLLLPSAAGTPTPFCAFEDALYPPYYVAYKAAVGSIRIDGVLDEPAWDKVA